MWRKRPSHAATSAPHTAPAPENAIMWLNRLMSPSKTSLREDRQERQQRQPQERGQAAEDGERDDRRLSLRVAEAAASSPRIIGFGSAGFTCLIVIESSATITTRNDRPFRPKHTAPPHAASVAPASSGPNTRARLNWIELSAIAFGRSFFSTSDGISAW